MINDNDPVLPTDPPAARREQFAEIHGRDQIPAHAMDMMAEILFGDPEPLRDGETMADAVKGMRDYRSPIQRKVHGDPNSKEAEEAVRRGAAYFAAAEADSVDQHNVVLDAYDLQRGAVNDPDVARRTRAALLKTDDNAATRWLRKRGKQVSKAKKRKRRARRGRRGW